MTEAVPHAPPLPSRPGNARARPPRPIVYDLSHLIARLRASAGAGIDRIDLAYATHFFAGSEDRHAARYTAGPPRLIAAARARRLTTVAQRVWIDAANDRAAALWAWLEAPPGGYDRARLKATRAHAPLGRRLLSYGGPLYGSARRAAPHGAVYLNVGYHRFEHQRFFHWLAERPDVDAVLMIHDLLPLDYPEFFAPGEAATFSVRIDTALRYGRAFLVSTEAVKLRLEQEMAKRGFAPRPIWAKPFPSPLAEFTPQPSARRSDPYFVVVGTIEPRKNHLLLLNLWRDWARRSGPPPRLVVVGGRGWENEQVVDMLDRCEILAPRVAEVADLASRDLAELITGARALLAPSFEEGYGLPIVEALALGTPVIAADRPAAREVSQGRATLLSPIDGEGWRREVERLASDDAHHATQKARAAGFAAPNWPDYFASLDAFIAGLRGEGE